MSIKVRKKKLIKQPIYKDNSCHIVEFNSIDEAYNLIINSQLEGVKIELLQKLIVYQFIKNRFNFDASLYNLVLTQGEENNITILFKTFSGSKFIIPDLGHQKYTQYLNKGDWITYSLYNLLSLKTIFKKYNEYPLTLVLQLPFKIFSGSAYKESDYQILTDILLNTPNNINIIVDLSCIELYIGNYDIFSFFKSLLRKPNLTLTMMFDTNATFYGTQAKCGMILSSPSCSLYSKIKESAGEEIIDLKALSIFKVLNSNNLLFKQYKDEIDEVKEMIHSRFIELSKKLSSLKIKFMDYDCGPYLLIYDIKSSGEKIKKLLSNYQYEIVVLTKNKIAIPLSSYYSAVLCDIANEINKYLKTISCSSQHSTE